ncbi:MAG: hypothetical protein JSS51_14830 [Planctomycetes bacterium]|nr:hypothetical protein [Planctomycetota bacterium]
MANSSPAKGMKEAGVAITMQRPAQDVFDRWMADAHSPAFAGQVIIVRREGETGFAWRATVTDAGNIEGGTSIASSESSMTAGWKSTMQAPAAGSLMLIELPYMRGTEVRVVLDPDRLKESEKAREAARGELRLSLLRFRQLLEAGEIATVRGQSSGRKGGRDPDGSEDEQQSLKSAGGRS